VLTLGLALWLALGAAAMAGERSCACGLRDYQRTYRKLMRAYTAFLKSDDPEFYRQARRLAREVNLIQFWLLTRGCPHTPKAMPNLLPENPRAHHFSEEILR